MIRFFHVNHPSAVVFLLLYTIVLHLVLFIEPASFVVESSFGPLSRFFFFLTEIIFSNNHYALALIALLLVFFQSLMVNALVNEAKLFETGTFVPAIIYVLCACLFRDFLMQLPMLLSLTFIIPAFGKTLNLFRRQQCHGDIYDMGFLIGVASLFYLPAFLLIILLFVALAIMRAFNWREWMIGALGFLTTYFLTATYFFLNDNLIGFFQKNVHYLTPVVEAEVDSKLVPAVIGSFSAVLAIAGAFLIVSNFLKSPVHIRKFFVLTGWLFLLLAISGLFGVRFSLSHFVILSLPLSLVISYLLLNIKRMRIANIIHLIWLAMVLFFQYFSV